MHSSAAAALCAVMLLTACGDQESPSSPTTETSEDGGTADDPGTATGTDPDTGTTSADAVPSILAPSPSTVTVTETATAAPAPVEPTEEEPAETTEEEPTDDDPTEQPGSGGECSSGAYTPADLRGEDVPGPAVERAEVLLAAALDCDSTTLVYLAEQDETSLSLGGGEPADLLAVPDPENQYLSIAVLLTATTPVVVDGRAAWPAALQPDADDDAWQEIIDAGLHTEEDVAFMREAGQYLGWRIGIDVEDGTWDFFVAGD